MSKKSSTPGTNPSTEKDGSIQDKKETFEHLSSKHSKFLENLSPHIKDQMEELFLHEELIKKHLLDAERLKEFIENPLEFFRNAKIELSPIVKRRLEMFNYKQQVEAKGFVLPNGKIMKPNVKIKIKIE
jgi:hypothetical protein